MNTFTRFQISRSDQINLPTWHDGELLNQILVTDTGYSTSARLQGEHFYWNKREMVCRTAPNKLLPLIWREAKPKRAVRISGDSEKYSFNVKDYFSSVANDYIELFAGIAIYLKLALFMLLSFITNPFKNTNQKTKHRNYKRPHRNTPEFEKLPHFFEKAHTAILPQKEGN